MTREYRKKLSGTALVLYGDDLTETRDYRIEVLKNNHIPGILPTTTCTEDGIFKLYFDITGKQEISTVFSKKKLEYKNVAALINGICSVLESTREHLLEPQGIIFDPEYIFISGEDKVSFAYFPDRAEDVYASLHALGEYLIGRVDHKDERAVKLAYGFFETTGKDEVLLEDIKGLVVPEVRASAPGVPEYSIRKPVYEINEPVQIPARAPAQREEVEEEKNHGKKQKGKKTIGRKKEKKEKDSKIKEPGKKSPVDYLIWTGAAAVILWLVYDNLFRSMGRIGIIAEIVLGLIVLGVLIGCMTGGKKKSEKSENSEQAGASKKHESHDRYEDYSHKERTMEPALSYDYHGTGLLQEEEEKTGLLESETYEKTGLLRECNDLTPALISVRDSMKQPLLITHFPFVVGKSLSYADGKIDDSFISRVHCRFDKKGDVHTLVDLASTNGTELDGELLTPNIPYVIHEGAEVKLGKSLFRFEMV